jgi:hypothetical protein
MCLAKVSKNHKDHEESYLPVVFSFVFFMNFVVKYCPRSVGWEPLERQETAGSPLSA